MKAHFINLFNYDCYANKLIAETITTANTPSKAVKLMAHLLAAQQIWINRCKGLPTTGVALWPDWQAGPFAGIITENSNAWLSYLDGLEENDFQKTISYKSLKGESFENKLIDILTHVINHGTHHRAQVGQQLKFEGVENLPNTDYIFYLRTLKN